VTTIREDFGRSATDDVAERGEAASRFAAIASRERVARAHPATFLVDREDVRPRRLLPERPAQDRPEGLRARRSSSSQADRLHEVGDVIAWTIGAILTNSVPYPVPRTHAEALAVEKPLPGK
jgi:hypothetical protein